MPFDQRDPRATHLLYADRTGLRVVGYRFSGEQQESMARACTTMQRLPKTTNRRVASVRASSFGSTTRRDSRGGRPKKLERRRKIFMHPFSRSSAEAHRCSVLLCGPEQSAWGNLFWFKMPKTLSVLIGGNVVACRYENGTRGDLSLRTVGAGVEPADQ